MREANKQITPLNL